MRRDSLTRKLEARPTIEDLVAQNIVKEMPSGVSTNLQQKSNELELNMTKSRLKQRLDTRPSTEQLTAVFPNIFTARSPPPYNSKKVAYESSLDENGDRTVLRTRYAIALKAAFRLMSTGQITADEKGVLKELILDHDNRVFGAIEVYELDHDAAELLDSLYRIAKLAAN